MRNGRRDANHAEIRDGLRDIPGVSVFDTADLGGGFFDIVVGVRGINLGIEIKDGSKPPSQRQLTRAEQKFHGEWQGQKAVVNSLDEALELLELIINTEQGHG